MRIYINNGKAVFEIDGSNLADYTNITGNSLLNDGIWHHIAVVRNGTQLLLYINGKSDATAVTVNGNPNINSSFMFSFGRVLNDFGNPFQYFSGSIDEAKIYNTNLSLANIQSDMLNTTISVPANLLAYYNFDNGVAGGTNTGITTLTDNSGNSNNGTLINFALTGNTSNWIESYAMVVHVLTAAAAITQTGFTANWTAPAVGTVDNNYTRW